MRDHRAERPSAAHLGASSPRHALLSFFNKEQTMAAKAKKKTALKAKKAKVSARPVIVPRKAAAKKGR